MIRTVSLLLLAVYILSPSRSQPTCSDEEKKAAEAEVNKCVEAKKTDDFGSGKLGSVEDVLAGLEKLACKLMAGIEECLKPMARCLTETEFRELFNATIANATGPGGHGGPGGNVAPRC